MSWVDDSLVTCPNFSALVKPAASSRIEHQNTAIAVIITFPALALMVVSVRVAGKLSTRQFSLDDGLVCIAMALAIVEAVASYEFIITNYIGMSAVDIPLHDPTQGAIWNYVVQVLYNPILALVKSSLLLLLLRLFGQKPGVRRFVIWVNTINLASLVSILFAIVFQCFPLQKAWKPQLEGFCVDRRILLVSASAVNIVLDLLILGLPLRIFIGLQIPKRTKIALMFLFLLGFLTTIVGISRLVLLVRGLYVLLEQPDPTSNISFIIIAIEANLSIITASAPALRPLLRAWFPPSSSSRFGRGAGGTTATTTRQQRERRDTVARVSAATDKMALGAGTAARVGRLRSAAASSRRSDDESLILPAREDVGRTDFMAQYHPPSPKRGDVDEEEQAGAYHDKEVVNIGLESGARKESWV
ncbi:hypothetical protein PGQ11_004511 [Apiospora arundinis]|uniref:Rhodopsin domain-containing protein n=1 Tax=Apiospora arundinis TaxID=335852 RepID=A0ABR2J9A0_9PEZI